MKDGHSFREALRQRIDKLAYRRTSGMFRVVYRLFDQATMCYDAKAYDAVCIMCRSTLEAVGYVSLTREKKEIGTLSKPPMGKKGVRQVHLNEFERVLSNVLSEPQKVVFHSAWERGDFIAHLMEIYDQKIWKSLRENPGAIPFEAVPKITEKEAVESIEACISTIPTVVHESVKNLKPMKESEILNMSDEQFEALTKQYEFGP